ncbi:hypothetical protein BC829DRAFT_121652 [Chytridium lagenaria]|nr:hypothetical protein BC829DRAFT_121652 [Chytridium lagenaria]
MGHIKHTSTFSSVMSSSSTFLLTALAWAFFAANSFAAPFPQNNQEPQQPTVQVGNSRITLGGILAGIIAIIFGLFIWSMGFKLYKPTIFVIGTLIGTIIGYTILTRAEPGERYAVREVVLLFGSIAIGLVFGIGLLFLRKLSVIMLGGLGGYFLGMFVLGLRPGTTIEQGWGRAIFLVILAIVGLVIGISGGKVFIIAVTAFIGAYGVVFGIDCFANTGFVEAAARSMSFGFVNSSDYRFDGKIIVMHVVILVLTAIGVFLQLGLNKNRPLWYTDAKK